MNSVTLIGNGVGGVIQGGLAGIAFAICGFQSVFMWSVIMVILAFIPLVGISIIYIPACIYLFITGSVASAISLFVFCSLVAFITENWFKPKYMGGQVKINSILVLLFILGGMGAWGMAGIFYGPVICVVFMTMVEIYHQKYAKDLIFHQEIQ
jgi:predicted PurR-regulated permease PerM